ncbi:MAG: hypothetical protein ACXADB_12075 [Candidatus Hermodarchaeia archaeon]|jgi:hypothetical protein
MTEKITKRRSLRPWTIDELAMGFRGEWQDTMRYLDGRTKVIKGPIKPNQIQNTFSTLLTSLCKGESGYDRIGYIGIGSGLVSWDSSTPSQPYSQTTLTTEYFRKAIDAADIVYIDPSTNLPTGGTPSSKIEITVTLLTSEANGTMREFGLFGGTATITLDSGEMVNWVVHGRIDKDTSLEIERQIRIEFATR